MYMTAPIGSMHGIVACIYLIFSVNVGKYSIHGSYGIYKAYDCSISFHICLDNHRNYVASACDLMWAMLHAKLFNVCCFFSFGKPFTSNSLKDSKRNQKTTPQQKDGWKDEGFIWSWYPKQPLFNGCLGETTIFYVMIWFIIQFKHPFINCCLGFYMIVFVLEGSLQLLDFFVVDFRECVIMWLSEAANLYQKL